MPHLHVPTARRAVVASLAVAVAMTLALAAGCGDDAGAGVPDAGPADGFASTCGQPGDPGNELGVGHFCQTLLDCGDTAEAPLCSNIGDETTWFCTKTCANEDAGVEVCGTGATCTCGNGGCGCTPTSCL